MLKEKPPTVAGAGVASGSLLEELNKNVEAAAEEVASFFSSGLPKLNAGAAGSISADDVDPKVEPPSGAVVVKLGSPSCPNTEPAEVEVVVVVLVDVVSVDDAPPSLFS